MASKKDYMEFDDVKQRDEVRELISRSLHDMNKAVFINCDAYFSKYPEDEKNMGSTFMNVYISIACSFLLDTIMTNDKFLNQFTSEHPAPLEVMNKCFSDMKQRLMIN